MLAYCDLLKDKNINEVNCEADFHYQAFHQKCTIHGKYIKPCASPVVVVYLTFCQQVAQFFSDELLYNFYSFHIHKCNILPASHFLLASHNTRVTHMLLESFLRDAHVQLVNTYYLAAELYRI